MRSKIREAERPDKEKPPGRAVEEGAGKNASGLLFA